MNSEPTSTPFRLVVTLIVLLFVGAVCFANEGTGTGTAGFCERHGCTADEGPPIECPDLTCPDVTCGATDCSKTTVVVNPTPVTCPTPAAVTFPNYYPCRHNKDGSYTCPRKATPRRVFMPETATGKQ